MKKEIPILFSTEMVQAIIQKCKTKTRRTKNLLNINPKATEVVPSKHWKKRGGWIAQFLISGEVDRYEITDVIKCPYGEVGDLLWVRETFAIGNHSGFYFFKANGEKPNGTTPWKPSIHMPKKATRIWLEIISIRVERLHDITEQDAKAEGVVNISQGGFGRSGEEWKNYWNGGNLRTAKHSFQSLWYSINGIESWNFNPWVWVIEFKQVQK